MNMIANIIIIHMRLCCFIFDYSIYPQAMQPHKSNTKLRYFGQTFPLEKVKIFIVLHVTLGLLTVCPLMVSLADVSLPWFSVCLSTRVSHKSTNVLKPRFTPRNHALGHIKSQIFWNFWNPSFKNTLFFEQRFRLQLHLAAVSGTIC